MSPNLRVVFAGTSDFAVPALRAMLDSGLSVCAVYTQPDRPSGRGRNLQPSPVKRLAETRSLVVAQPETLRAPEVLERLQMFHADLMVVAAYGLILPPEALQAARLGCVNIHASLLPRWRGAAPVQRAILAGDQQTGVTLMQMDQGLDTGDILAASACRIRPEETAGELQERLAKLGARLLLELLPDIGEGHTTPRAQREADATYARKLSKDEATLVWSLEAQVLARQVRAFNPWPIARTTIDGEMMLVRRARSLPSECSPHPPGTVTATGSLGIDVATGHGTLRLLEVQAAGRRAMSAAQFVHARPLEGRVLGS